MQLTEVQKAKIIIEIDWLAWEVARLEKEAEERDSMYCSALATYGSELAGPPPTVIEVNINTARLLREMANFLKNMLDMSNGGVDLNVWRDGVKSDLSKTEAKIAKLNEKLAKLEKEKRNLESSKARFEKFSKLLTS